MRRDNGKIQEGMKEFSTGRETCLSLVGRKDHITFSGQGLTAHRAKDSVQ